MRTGENPCRGIERNHEVMRKEFLSKEQLDALSKTLVDHEDQQCANVLRMLLLTGARKGEVLSMRWDNIRDGRWNRPSSSTKQKRDHHVPLSAPAQQLLASIPREGTWVFPSHSGAGHRVSIERPWVGIRKSAGLGDIHIHDLRHTYASVLASAGVSLLTIGALLGHSQPQTTQRYAHLVDDALRQATERAGAIIAPGQQAEVVELKRRRR
jgi:integrase